MELSDKLTIEEEQELVTRTLRGDGDAFGRIYDAYSKSIFQTVIISRLRDEKAAEEVLQETFLLALRKLESFEWQDRSIFFWLRMIAINKCREYIASSRRHSTVDSSVLDFQPDTSYQPEEAVVSEDFAAIIGDRIDDVLEDIRDRYATSIRLRLKENRSREYCAKKMDVTIETFDVLFFRACKAFRQAYINKYGKL